MDHGPSVEGLGPPDHGGVGLVASRKGSERKDSASWVYDHWQQCEELTDTGKQQWACIYCHVAKYRHNVTRMRAHLISCEHVPEGVKAEARAASERVAGRRTQGRSRRPQLYSTDLEERSDEAGTSGMPSKKRHHGAEDFATAGELQEELEVLLARMFMSLNMDLTCLKDRKLRKFVRTLNHRFRLPSEEALQAKMQELSEPTEQEGEAEAVAEAPTVEMQAREPPNGAASSPLPLPSAAAIASVDAAAVHVLEMAAAAERQNAEARQRAGV